MAETQHVMYGRVRYTTSKHPLYKTWRNMAFYDPDSGWSDFAHFADTVGLRPPRTKLKRLDESKPFGPYNWQWRPLRPVVNG